MASSSFVFVVTFFLTYAVDAFLVGLALALYRERTGRGAVGPAVVGTLFLVFAALDTYVMAGVAALDATITINAPALADLLEVAPNTPLAELFELGIADLLVWAAQVGAALWVADRFSGPRMAAA